MFAKKTKKQASSTIIQTPSSISSNETLQTTRCPDGSSLLHGKCPSPIPTPLPGSLTFLSVSTKVINNNAGTNNPSDFTITVTGNSPSPNTFPGNSREGGTTVSLKPSSYKVTETGPSGYTSSFSSDCSGQINAGQNRACIITNEAKKPTTNTSDC